MHDRMHEVGRGPCKSAKRFVSSRYVLMQLHLSTLSVCARVRCRGEEDSITDGQHGYDGSRSKEGSPFHKKDRWMMSSGQQMECFDG